MLFGQDESGDEDEEEDDEEEGDGEEMEEDSDDDSWKSCSEADDAQSVVVSDLHCFLPLLFVCFFHVVR